MKYYLPLLYANFLLDFKKTEEMKDLYDGKPTVENYSWYIILHLNPQIRMMRSKGQLISD